MTPELILPLVARWAHIGAAVVLVGGSVFIRFVLMPAAKELPEDQHQALGARLMNIWKRVIMLGIGLFLLSGFYNYLAVTRFQHSGDKWYHMLIGIKILLAFCVFFLASVLAGRAPVFQKFRDNRRLWLGVVIALAAVIIGISGYVKVVH